MIIAHVIRDKRQEFVMNLRKAWWTGAALVAVAVLYVIFAR
jgi:hypothetical protein